MWGIGQHTLLGIVGLYSASQHTSLLGIVVGLWGASDNTLLGHYCGLVSSMGC
jgi:hypothetical protein